MRTEQVDVEERALRYVAKAGDGSMRDALSLLDQCIAFHLGKTHLKMCWKCSVQWIRKCFPQSAECWQKM
ncbi:MAG: hypothetical protein ACLTBB_12975 [Roseburia hominis]